MSSARLTALRLVGFKSFAERTTIEFGPGISAVVGPNGSGKSNLADALRWTLGEQGRSLRTRRAEDVIFAGSSSRKAVGMADVTLVIDNSDRLLPVDFGEVEISRRLYRSGENEYLLNRQRLRLRDLVELLDAGNLADNAFLFIGQGMVDQALALRPEERRPLFEEAAGVRRHERRRRQAEAELAEAEANLERLRDVLGELRPQARRLAAQAEQLEARRTAGLELAEALLAAARARWLAADEGERRESRALAAARAAADKALAELHAAEEEAAQTSEQMSTHAEQERARRTALDKQRAQIVELRVADARLVSELAALHRDLDRITAEREGAEARLRELTLGAAGAPPVPDSAVAAELEGIERALRDLGVDSDTSRVTVHLERDDRSRELESRRAELNENRRRADDAADALDKAHAELARLSDRLRDAETERDAAVAALTAAAEDETTAHAKLDEARERARSAVADVTGASERVGALDVETAAAKASLAAVEATLEAGSDDGLAHAARARGASLVAEGLDVDARFRNAVSAALDHAASAFAVDDPAPLLGKGRRGALVVRGGVGKREARGGAAAAGVIEAAREHGGGPLSEAIRRDPQGEVTRLLERVVWTPDVGSALQTAPALTAGWRVVTLEGDAITDQGVVRLGAERNILEQRAEREELRRRVAELEERLSAEAARLAAARVAAESASADVSDGQKRLDQARAAHRSAEERERLSQRRAEQWLREVTWQQTQVERLSAAAASAHALVEHSAAEVAQLEARAETAGVDDQARDDDARRARLRARRDELRASKAAEESRIAAWREERRVADVRRALDETRVAELDAAQMQLNPRRAQLTEEKNRVAALLADLEAREAEAARLLEEILAAGADDRRRLMDAEKAAADARERLRAAEQQSRRSEVAQMEARMQLEQVREGLLVELAGIGYDGLVALQSAADLATPSDPDEAADAPSSDAFETALDATIAAWRAADQQALQEPPSASRLGTLRRRFHELGAGNPFAAEEYAELRERLDAMEAQRTDLETAIASTRELIASLTALITDQFRRTFAALEDAFARRFHELFGGGDAELTLTAPDDLSATGVEIHARPPGKKRQPLSMLSGGERALTAVSLLLAMLEVRPVPFCVLDEVDAALDEANIGRFSKALRGLAEQTQFIVITHNRGTIEGADALYGVTLGDDAVSRIVSLRLPEPGTEPSSDGKSRELTGVMEPAEAAVA